MISNINKATSLIAFSSHFAKFLVIPTVHQRFHIVRKLRRLISTKYCPFLLKQIIFFWFGRFGQIN